jgi:hypothetical protein
MRARNAGNRLVFVPAALVWHKISRTCGAESSFTLYLGTRNQLAWVAKHVPMPYKPVALSWTFLKKFLKAARLAIKNPNSAEAVLGGIWAYLFGVYGPPRDNRPRNPSTPASAWSIAPEQGKNTIQEKRKEL